MGREDEDEDESRRKTRRGRDEVEERRREEKKRTRDGGETAYGIITAKRESLALFLPGHRPPYRMLSYVAAPWISPPGL